MGTSTNVSTETGPCGGHLKHLSRETHLRYALLRPRPGKHQEMPRAKRTLLRLVTPWGSPWEGPRDECTLRDGQALRLDVSSKPSTRYTLLLLTFGGRGLEANCILVSSLTSLKNSSSETGTCRGTLRKVTSETRPCYALLCPRPGEHQEMPKRCLERNEPCYALLRLGVHLGRGLGMSAP